MSWVAAAIIGGGSIIGGLIGSRGASKAGQQQAAAAQQAAALQQQQYQQTRSDLMPWMEAGEMSLDKLQHYLGLAPQGAPGAPGTAGAMPTREQFTRNIAAIPGITIQNPNAGMHGSPYITYGAAPARSEFDEAAYSRAVDLARREQAQQAAQGQDPTFGSLLRPFGLDQFQESPAYQFNLQQGLDAINKGASARNRGGKGFYAPATLQDLTKFSQGLASNEFLNAYNMYNQDQSNIYGRLMGVSNQGEAAGAQVGNFGMYGAAGAGNAMMGAGNAQAAGTMGQANAWAGALSGLGDAARYYQLNRLLTAPNYSPQIPPSYQG